MKKILIVDDNADNRYMLDVLFKSNGFHVMIASNGSEALEQAGLEAPDIAVSDILMPVMDGYALCKKWQTDDTLRHIPFVFYTATYTEQKDEEFALSLGAVRFIRKPIDMNELRKIILEVLDEGRLQTPVDAPVADEDSAEYYRQYNERLVRKLEHKMLQLEKTNAVLQEEINERKKAEEALRILLDEKEALLGELYHRTRNNMQLICSLLSIRLSYTPGSQLASLVADMHNRIESLALVHKKLYEAKNLSSIVMSSYIRELCASLAMKNGMSGKRVSFQYDMDETSLPLEIAAPFGLVVNELVTNSLKHAFQDGRNGVVSITLRRQENQSLDFTYSDNGPGLPAGFNYKTDGAMGFELISILVTAQLKGTLVIGAGAGFRCDIRLERTAIKNFEQFR